MDGDATNGWRGGPVQIYLVAFFFSFPIQRARPFFLVTKNIHLLIAAAVLAPIAVKLPSVGGKPIHLVPSDFLLVLLPLIIALIGLKRGVRISARLKSVIAWTSILVLYAVALAVLSGMREGSLVTLFSCFKFIKPFILFVLFLALFSSLRNLRSMVEIYLFVCVVCIAILIIGSARTSGFPICRWGGDFLGLEVYGFPNSSASFMVLQAGLILAGTFFVRSRSLRWLLIISFVLCDGLVIMSMSRASTASLLATLGTFFTLLPLFHRMKKTQLILRSLVALLLMVGLAVFLVDVLKNTGQLMDIYEALLRRVEKINQGVDPFAGRSIIWQDCLNLIADRPVFGYMFESFSKYGTHDTPHNQYLEIFFKIGIIGFILCVIAFFTVITKVVGGSRLSTSDLGGRLMQVGFFAGLAGLLLGNISQPNFSFSLTGNALAFWFAYFLVLNERSRRQATTIDESRSSPSVRI